MKIILCDNKTCIYNEVWIRNNLTVCVRCNDISINSHKDSCDGYEKIEECSNKLK